MVPLTIPYHCLLWVSGRFGGPERSFGNIGGFSLGQCFPDFDVYK